MRVNWITVVKYVWVSAGLFMLGLGLGLCLVDPGYYASLNLFPVMLVLSFPLGPLVLLLGVLVIDPPSLHPALTYSLLWCVAFAVGYWQWFRAFPKLFSEREITTLGLTQAPPLNVTANRPSQPSSRPTKRLQVRTANHLPHFDRRGRTPLERVIDQRLNRNGCSQVLSEKRRDLPGVNGLPGQFR